MHKNHCTCRADLQCRFSQEQIWAKPHHNLEFAVVSSPSSWLLPTNRCLTCISAVSRSSRFFIFTNPNCDPTRNKRRQVAGPVAGRGGLREGVDPHPGMVPRNKVTAKRGADGSVRTGGGGCTEEVRWQNCTVDERAKLAVLCDGRLGT